MVVTQESHMKKICLFILLSLFWVLGYCLPCKAVDYPGSASGKAAVGIQSEQLRLENELLAVQWRRLNGRLRLHEIIDKQTGIKLSSDSELFVLRSADGKASLASELVIKEPPRVEDVPADAKAIRLGDRFAGKRIVATFTDREGRMLLAWQAVLRDEANYVRQVLTIQALGEDLALAEIVLLELPASEARQIGETRGSPIAAGNLFFACESPLAENEVVRGRIRCRLPRQLPIRTGEAIACQSVIGASPLGQLRRAFLYYLERERPRPYQPFLHYNCYYDISWACRKYNEQEALEAIEQFGRELVQKRGVRLDGCVFDNGWDEPNSPWEFHEGFPRGFAPLREAANRYGIALGVWISPCGGGGPSGKARREFSRKQGYEVNAYGLSPAGPNYYRRLFRTCVEMLDKYDVRLFKFDEFGVGNTALGKSYRRPLPEEAADTEAMLRLISELRTRCPNVFISTTVGTWPSPFWLLYSDSIWRNDSDMGFRGTGSLRQQWITYRDGVTQEMIVRPGPLYPLNSLMTQGIAHGRLGTAARLSDDLKNLKDEVRMFFASGTQLQELYVSPQRMTPEMWDVLAEAAGWSRANAEVLVDTHWIGGDALHGEVYGYAAWSRRKGIVALRNPSQQPAKFTLDLQAVWELPPAAPKTYSLKSPWAEDGSKPAVTVSTQQSHILELAPFEVLVLEGTPVEVP